MVAQATWMPSTEYGKVYNRAELPESVFAFPRQRKEPLTDEPCQERPCALRPGRERFRRRPRARLRQHQEAAQYYGVDVKENSWRELGRR